MTGDSYAPAGYESPCIEQVLTADELAREVHYAGFVSPGPPDA